jgi:hypothetical protein
MLVDVLFQLNLRCPQAGSQTARVSHVLHVHAAVRSCRGGMRAMAMMTVGAWRRYSMSSNEFEKASRLPAMLRHTHPESSPCLSYLLTKLNRKCRLP